MKSTGFVEEEVGVDSSSDFENEETETNLTGAPHSEELKSEQRDGDNAGCTVATTTQSSSSKGKSMKQIGPLRGAQAVGEPIFLEFDSLYNPIGKWARKFDTHVSTCAYMVDINIESYFDLDDVERNKNWEEAKRLFNIQEPGLAKKESKFYSLVAARFRNRKSKLRRRWLMKSDEASCDEQPGHEECDEQSRDIEVEEGEGGGKKSKKPKQNKHPHRMGQNSYYIVEQKWIKDGGLSPATESSNSSVDSPFIAFRAPRRPKVWKLAHEKKLTDDSWSIDPSAVKTKEIAPKIEDQQLEAEAKSKADDTFVQEHGMDALSKGIGKRDHRGRVKAIHGLNVGIEKMFGKVNRRGQILRIYNSESIIELAKSQAKRIIKEMWSRFDTELNERVNAAVEKALKNRFGCITKDSTHLPDTLRGSVSKVVSMRPRILEVNTPCYLAVIDTETKNFVVVADGTAYPNNSTTPVIHNEQSRIDHYKVSLDNPYLKHINVELPRVSKDGETTKVGQAKGHFLKWPVDQVIFMDVGEVSFRGKVQLRGDAMLGAGKEASSRKENQTPKSSIGSSTSQIKTFDPVIEENLEENLDGDHVECQTLNLLLSSANEFKSFVITIAPPLFYYTVEKHYSVVTRGDIEEFLKGDCINVSILHVYQLFLMEKYSHFFDRSLVSFLCPVKLSADIAEKQPTEYRDYLRDAFMAEKNKKDKRCKFLLAPYNEGAHWMLFVIELQAGQVYVFNSIRNDNLWNLKIYPFLNGAFEIYKANEDTCTETSSKELSFFIMECAQQPGGVECGYYTMMFMHEIVSMYPDCNNLKDEYVGMHSYTTQDLSFLREQWAEFFRLRYSTP